MTFNWFDVGLAVLIVISGIAGFRSGLIRVIVGILATIVGLIAGFWCYRMVAVKLAPFIDSTVAADIIGFFIIFVGAIVLGALMAAILSRLFRRIGLSWINQLLGGVAGLIRGALVVAILATILIAFSPRPTPAFIENSRVLPYASEVAAALADLAPRELKDSFIEQLKNLKELWSEPGSHAQGQIA
jgi:membrane protein required for colicin V production